MASVRADPAPEEGLSPSSLSLGYQPACSGCVGGVRVCGVCACAWVSSVCLLSKSRWSLLFLCFTSPFRNVRTCSWWGCGHYECGWHVVRCHLHGLSGISSGRIRLVVRC